MSSAEGNFPEMREQNMLKALDPGLSNFTTMKSRRADVKIGLEGLQNHSTGNFAIYKDSIIALSIIPALGFEAFRILCTRDSVIIINRLEKSYYAASINEASRKYNIPVGFQELQAILINEVFYYKENYEDREYVNQLNSIPGGNLYMIDAYRGDRRLTRQGIEIDSLRGNITDVFVVDYERRMQLDLSYDEFSGTGSFLFPNKLNMKIADLGKTIRLEIKYGQTVFDDPVNVEFEVPANYRREEL